MDKVFPILGTIVSILTAMCALWLSYKVYIRQRSLENENHFFKYKIDEYQTIIYKATELVDQYYCALSEMIGEIKDGERNIDFLNDLADSVDDSTNDFRLILQKNCAFIPKEIVQRLDKFYDNLSVEFEDLDEKTYSVLAFDKIWDNLDTYEIEIEKINDLMRDDLGIDAIDRRLKNRTRHTGNKN